MKSKLKFNIIISLIGILISLICLLCEMFILKGELIFWLIIFSCNLVIFISNFHEYKKK